MSSAVIFTYTFIPDANQCSTAEAMTIVVNPQITPAFTQLGPYCVGATPDPLPGTSLNGITGSWNPAAISTASTGTTIYTFTLDAGQCGSQTTMSVQVTNSITPTFTQLGPYCVGATPDPLPGTSLNGITGSWNPAAISTASTGTTIYTFTPDAGQCGSQTTMSVQVTNNITPTFTQLGPYCVGATPDPLPGTSLNGITGSWNPAAISTASTGTTIYTFTPDAGQCGSQTTMSVQVTNSITPTVTQLGPYCVGAAAGNLPTTSNNGITGSWNPAVISTASTGTTIYTFTPDAGQCGSQTTMSVQVTNSITPTFTQLGPYCVGATPDPLPGTSLNGITGSWNPAAIFTASTGTTIYTFTPDAGQCGSQTTMSVQVTNSITPTFTQLGPYCVGATPDPLPGTSLNGITGSWNPAAISTASTGTTINTFTPDAGQCGSQTTMSVQVTNNITPTFTQLGPYCVGATPDPLPGTSLNGITGSWNPAAISTASTGTTIYTFTPDAGQCGSQTTMSVQVTNSITPTFTQLGPYCVGATPDPLPGTSLNGITGSWNPAAISTASTGTTIYTFTPDAGQCGSQTTMSVQVTNSITPTFTQLGPYCVGATPDPLPGTSLNGITGSWNPAAISTASTGTTIYTFTPDAGQCGSQTTMSVQVTNSITPTFTQLGPYCVGATPDPLPGTSLNGITGSWNPAAISTASTGTTIYTFTPDAGQCGSQTTMSVQVTNSITPTFTQLGPYCVGATPDPLPGTSLNGITGSWNPAAISTASTGTTIYTFTPDAGQCGSQTTMSVQVTNSITPTFTQLGPYCVGATPDPLPGTSLNGITGSWNPAAISTASTGTTIYTFTPDAGQCGSQTTMSVQVTNSITPTFTQLGPYCVGATPDPLPGTSLNGITGSWNPAAISTASTGTTIYTFTPDAGQCGSQTTMSVQVTNSITPTFTQLGPYCVGATPDPLPGTSLNGITGSWNPAAISTASTGTTIYTFTPDAGQCGSQTTMSLQVTNSITPTFTQLGPLNQNSIAPNLPGISNNGITGIWNPAAINTSILGTFTYTFTPDNGQCGTVFTMNIDIISGSPVLTITKTATETGYSAAGDQIHYNITVTNTGSITLTNISVSDPLTSINQTITSLDPYASRTFSATYTVVSSDVTTGQVVNTATASYSIGSNNYNETASHTVPLVLSGNALTISKSATETNYSVPGDQIHYTITVANTGSVTLTDITVTDLLTGLNRTITTLAPGSNRTFNETYSVVAADITAGQVVNTATASYTFGGNNYNENASHTVTAILTGNALTISKSAAESSFSALGDIIHYTVTVTNTGSATLTNISVTDPLTGLNQTITSLAPGANRTFNTTYTIVQNDLNAGEVNNTATASYTFGGNNYNEAASHTVSANLGPGLSIAKSVSESNYSAVGDILNYTIIITNTGNVTLTNIAVSDPLTGLNQTVATLAPGASRTFNTTYSVVQNDLNAGIINNTARASYTFAGTPYSETASESISANASPELSINKSVSESSYTSVGDILHYTITVTNTGNVTLTNVSVSDPLTGLNQNIGNLNPGASRTFNTTHTIVQNDINNGSVNNTATANYSFGGNTHNVSDSQSVAADIRPELSVSKTSSESAYSVAGDVIHYTITVTNSGNVTITGVVSDDPNTNMTCPGSPQTLAPGASMKCTATHVVTSADILSASISNTATANGYGPSMETVTATSNTVVVRLNNLPPTVNCQSPIVTNTEANTCDAQITSGLSATYSDPNDNIESLTWVMTGATVNASPLTGINNLTSYTFHGGVTTITYTVTDQPGLSASCSFNVTVTDNVAPTISCVAPQDRSTDTDHPYYTVAGTEFDPTSLWDNCTIASLTNDFNASNTLAGAHFPIGLTPVIWTVTDEAGLTASCNFTVTVIDDVKPVAMCKNIDVYLDLNTGTVSISPEDIDNGSWDNTAIGSMTIDRNIFTCSDLGPNNVTLTVTDIYDNVATCTATVTVHYAVVPNPTVTPSEDVICNEETINLALANNIPNTAWTWTVNTAPEIEGASDDKTGLNTSIIQTLANKDLVVHPVTYTILPKVYGQCLLPTVTAEIWVNPQPEITLNIPDTVLCNGESASISVQNPNTSIRGQWIYNLTVEPEAGITGNTLGGSYTTPTDLNETLFNSDVIKHKITYHFTARIVPDDGGPVCDGTETNLTIWVYPIMKYNTDLSSYNGYNVSCFGKSTGFIKIEPTLDLSPYVFSWTGPDGFTSAKEDISGLSAGHYTMSITDRNGCTVTDEFDLNEPDKLGLTINTSVSNDGTYNINCAGEKTGSIDVSAFNNVGSVDYMWIDGSIGKTRTNLQAGTYKIIILDSNNCQADSSITLTEPDKMKLTFNITEPFCPEKSDGDIVLNVTGGISASNYTYKWSDNSTLKDISDIPAGLYGVIVTDMNGCSVKDSVFLQGLNETCLIIPEAFSPNGDLINDLWIIGNTDLYPNMEITIYNRWGQSVWKSERGYPIPWNGRSDGKELPIDSYHYVIDLHNGIRPVIGSVTIIR